MKKAICWTYLGIGLAAFFLVIYDPLVVFPNDEPEWVFWGALAIAGICGAYVVDWPEAWARARRRHGRVLGSLLLPVSMPMVLAIVAGGYWYGWHYIRFQNTELRSVIATFERIDRTGRRRGLVLKEPMFLVNKIGYLPKADGWDQFVGLKVCLTGQMAGRAMDVLMFQVLPPERPATLPCPKPYRVPTLQFVEPFQLR